MTRSSSRSSLYKTRGDSLTAIGATIASFAVIPTTRVSALIAVAVLAGAARGLHTLIQATAVTDRWGSSHYGRLSSRLSGPALLASASAPWAGSALVVLPGVTSVLGYQAVGSLR